MFDRNEIVFELVCFLFRTRQDAAESLSHIDLTRVGASPAHLWNSCQLGLDLLLQCRDIQAGQLERRISETFIVFEQTRDQVLDIDSLIMTGDRQRLSAAEGL